MTSDEQYDVLVCGAGIAGVAVARDLAQSRPDSRIALVERGTPLGFTTACSGENVRDYWPQAAMQALAERSIERMAELDEASSGRVRLRRSGYAFVSESDRALFPGNAGTRIADPDRLRNDYPHLSPRVRAVTLIDNAGAIDVHGLGSLLLQQARAAGVTLLREDIRSLIASTTQGFTVQTASGVTLSAREVVLCTGPFLPSLLEQLGIKLPIDNVLQQKFVMPDPLGAIPPEMPFTIVADPQRLRWNDEERDLLAGDAEFSWLLNELPAGLHCKPEGRGHIKLGWAFNRTVTAPLPDPPADDAFPGIVLRGAARYLPALAPYVDNTPTPIRSFAGYYTRTPENWPLIGPVGPDGLYVVGALSGYGTMVAMAAAELCVAWMNGDSLPEHARTLSPGRYNDPALRAAMAASHHDGQL